MSFHLGKLNQGFTSGLLDEDTVENAEETHFLFNMDNGKTLEIRGEQEVLYADFVSFEDPITMMVWLTGGKKNASIQPPIIVFQNSSLFYPILGVPNNVPGVCYRSSPKGLMDGPKLIQCLSEPR